MAEIIRFHQHRTSIIWTQHDQYFTVFQSKVRRRALSQPYDLHHPCVPISAYFQPAARAQVSIGAPEVQTRVQELSKQVVQDLLADAKTMHIATAFVQQLLATREVRDSAAALTVWVLQVCRPVTLLMCRATASSLRNTVSQSVVKIIRIWHQKSQIEYLPEVTVFPLKQHEKKRLSPTPAHFLRLHKTASLTAAAHTRRPRTRSARRSNSRRDCSRR